MSACGIIILILALTSLHICMWKLTTQAFYWYEIRERRKGKQTRPLNGLDIVIFRCFGFLWVATLPSIGFDLSVEWIGNRFPSRTPANEVAKELNKRAAEQ